MKVIAFGASTSKNSINHTLALYAANMLKSMNGDVQIEALDLNDYEMPIYSEDREESGIPDQAKAFFEDKYEDSFVDKT